MHKNHGPETEQVIKEIEALSPELRCAILLTGEFRIARKRPNVGIVYVFANTPEEALTKARQLLGETK
jgi:hypothetical protein